MQTHTRKRACQVRAACAIPCRNHDVVLCPVPDPSEARLLLLLLLLLWLLLRLRRALARWHINVPVQPVRRLAQATRAMALRNCATAACRLSHHASNATRRNYLPTGRLEDVHLAHVQHGSVPGKPAECVECVAN